MWFSYTYACVILSCFLGSQLRFVMYSKIMRTFHLSVSKWMMKLNFCRRHSRNFFRILNISAVLVSTEIHFYSFVLSSFIWVTHSLNPVRIDCLCARYLLCLRHVVDEQLLQSTVSTHMHLWILNWYSAISCDKQKQNLSCIKKKII